MTDALIEIGIVVAVGAVAVGLGGPLVVALFRRLDRHADVDRITDARSSLRGGAWIGVLERIAVYATLVAGWPEGLALVAVVKGLGRYPELKGREPDVSERFIIGTFTSVLWAAGGAGVARWLVSLVA